MKKLLTLFIILFIHFSAESKPLISIITSVYKAEKFMRSFLDDIVQQTIFDACELIIINANSPQNEEPIILEFCQKYPNIHYQRLDHDPGLYAVWNRAIAQAQGQYITNANVDDRLSPDCYQVYIAHIQHFPQIDVVYSDYYVTKEAPTTTFLAFPQAHILYSSAIPQFNLQLLKRYCYIGPHPLWRKSLHDRFGYFDESYRISGDWEFWLRCATQGARFYKIKNVLGIYYENPQGLSTAKDDRHIFEDNLIRKKHS